VMMVVAALAYRCCWRRAAASRPADRPAGASAQPGEPGAAGLAAVLPAAP
jgi:hypothetical protein